ncbi:DUF5658 family protein [Peribacillus alkalitolerans]|uniref:DUF5658 family protein n=1 Tax=Peribacillus alkalitolerans TaxID=1550385 RepID=UPI0013D3CAFB|nr:DUF5658 family protein [Peribacillus alkalitolerans]
MLVAFLYLAALNLIDGYITWFGVHHSYIQEGNPLMASLFDIHPMLFIGVKVLLSAFLLLFILTKSIPKSPMLKSVTAFASAIYTAIFFLHSYWLLQLI